MNKTGVHYTPRYVADFVVDKISNYFSTSNPIILEPCVGEGVFIASLQNNLSNKIQPTIDAVEVCKATCDKTRKIYSTKFLKNISNVDYLAYTNHKKYDLIIGNPPYINIKHMAKSQISICNELSEVLESSSSAPQIKNLWTAFIVKSCELLNDSGVIAFILPSDFAHVSHAVPVKKYLLSHFDRIELYEFDSIVFSDAEQHVMLMIAIKGSGKHLPAGLFHSNAIIKNNKVKENKIEKLHNIVPNKWTNYGLTHYEISMLKRFYDELYQVKKFCESSTGIVTAANNYFILNKNGIDNRGLQDYTVPIIQKAVYVNGSVAFEKKDWDTLKETNSPCYLLDFSGDLGMNSELEEYLSLGKKNKINERYKCSLRETWYSVPNIKTHEGFFFKRCHRYPKLIMNNADVCITDTAYSIKMCAEYNLRSLIYSFYNSLSLVYSEILGRKYAGGVLEITPSEFRNIPLPYVEINKPEFTEFKKCFSEKKDIVSILSVNNKEILRNGLGISKKDVDLIHSIYNKVISSRLRV